MSLQFRVTIPNHVKAGETIRIRCPDGTEGDVKVPRGLIPGESFIFEMPIEAFVTPSNPQEAVVEKKGFLDREMATMEDFIMALGVGLFIGGSIVLGFLFGILMVTDPDTVLEQQLPHGA